MASIIDRPRKRLSQKQLREYLRALRVSNGQGGHNYFGGSGPDRNQWVSVKWLPPEWLGSRMDRS